MPQLKTVCPGCGEFTLLRTGHFIAVEYSNNRAIKIFCPHPKDDPYNGRWFEQGTLLDYQDVIPAGQQLGLL